MTVFNLKILAVPPGHFADLGTCELPKLRFMVVEDEFNVREDNIEMLKEFGYSTGENNYGTAEEALAEIEILFPLGQAPHIVLMDINLAGEMKGTELAHILYTRFGIASVFTTAYADDEFLGQAAESCALTYLIKPLEQRALKAALQTAAKRFQLEQQLREKEAETRELNKALAVANAALEEKVANRTRDLEAALAETLRLNEVQEKVTLFARQLKMIERTTSLPRMTAAFLALSNLFQTFLVEDRNQVFLDIYIGINPAEIDSHSPAQIVNGQSVEQDPFRFHPITDMPQHLKTQIADRRSSQPGFNGLTSRFEHEDEVGLLYQINIQNQNTLAIIPVVLKLAHSRGASIISSHLQLILNKLALFDNIMMHLSGSLTVISLIDDLKRQAISDGLTGLFNKFFFNAHIPYIFDQSKRENNLCAVGFIDLNFFKTKINDAHGHDFGDEFLKEVADLLSKRLRKSDIIVRMGGDEFVVIMPDTTQEEAEMVFRELAASTETNPFQIGDKQVFPSFSIGITDSSSFESHEAMMLAVDKAMYGGKAQKDQAVEKQAPTIETHFGHFIVIYDQDKHEKINVKPRE